MSIEVNDIVETRLGQGIVIEITYGLYQGEDEFALVVVKLVDASKEPAVRFFWLDQVRPVSPLEQLAKEAE